MRPENIVIVGTVHCPTCETTTNVHENLHYAGVFYKDNHPMVLNNNRKGTKYQDIVTCWGSLGLVREFERV